jgi:replicative DNA helicase
MAARDDDRPTKRRSSPARTDGRVPPHNLDAEESLLGALLLSRDVVGTVAELGLQVEHFYKPSHQHIYASIRGLMASGQPVDVVTVADELRRNGLLDEVGGAQMLMDLQNATPAVSNATRYAKIVQDTALLRRMITVASEIAEIAYTEPDDVTKALDEAETKVFEVAEDRVIDSTRPLGDLLPLAMDKLQETFDRGDSITGTATGFHDLDDVLSGLQPSTLNIIGARPAMGKCVAWDTPMADPITGMVRTAEEWYQLGTTGSTVACTTLDDDGRMVDTVFGGFYADGYKPLYRVRTRSGRTVRLTTEHPLLTGRGWMPLADIAVGELIAVPPALDVFGSLDFLDDDIDLLALGAHNNRVPEPVFMANRPTTARFVRTLFSEFGDARVRRVGRSFVSYGTLSEQMCRDVLHLLVRFGIRAECVPTRVRVGGVRRAAFEVVVSDAASLVAFCDEIGIEGRDEALGRLAARLEPVARRTANRLPLEVWDDVDKERGELDWAEVNQLAGVPDGYDWRAHQCRPRREVVARLAEALESDVLRRWASPDVWWDAITAIEPCGWDRVYDFNVPGTHNFVAADVYVHNTAFGLGIATHVAMTTKKPVLFFSLEMGHAELTQRILSSEARVDSQKLRTGRLVESDWTKIGKAINRLEIPLLLDDNPRVTVMEIRAKARRMKARYGGLSLLVIDYLQLMSGGSNSENRQLEVSEISRGLKILARELETPIIALSQLSRTLETRADKRPMLADLRESGSLEQDADVVMFLYRDEVYNRESADKGVAEVIIAKHRSGPTGLVKLVFNGVYTKFDNAARGL